VLELDEVWSFVYGSANKRWLWTALCRLCVVVLCKLLPSFLATIVLKPVPNCGQRFQKPTNTVTPSVISGFEVENPQPLSCNEHGGFSTSTAYAKVFPKATHRMVGKGAGETCHMERWNCILRQRLARFVRKTLSFSKSDVMHEVVLKAFITDYNLACVSER
jgi:IS1 family transposase